MRTFGEMKSNVGGDIQDTSSSMLLLIANYLNKRYLDIVRLCGIKIVNSSYTITTVAGAEDYTLPSDFGQELYCINSTTNQPLERIELESMVRDYYDSLTTQGEPARYSIFTNNTGDKILRLHYIPSDVWTIKLPYASRPVRLVSDADTPLLPCEDAMEAGAKADALRYKKQSQRAQAFDVEYNMLVSNLVWDYTNQCQPVQFTPTTFNRDLLA